MPLYDVHCSACSVTSEIWSSMSDRDDIAPCECGQDRERIFVSPIAMSDIDGYVSPLDGEWVGSRSQHREHMKRHNVFEMGNEKPGLGPREVTIPKDAIRATIRDTAERMKSHGTWREV